VVSNRQMWCRVQGEFTGSLASISMRRREFFHVRLRVPAAFPWLA
jgi:hypothetical protein